MMGIGAGTRIFLAAGATDMRKGYDGLFAAVKHRLAEDPLSGHLFVFCNRGRTRLKILYWDGTGLWVCGKRLEKGRFAWPGEAAGEPGAAGAGKHKLRLGAAEFAMLLGGLDPAGAGRRRWLRMGV